MGSSKDDFYKEGHSCLIPFLLILVALAVGGYFLLKRIGFDFSKILPHREHTVEIIDPSQFPEPPPVEKPKTAVVERVVEEEPPKPPPPKTMAELKAEADAAQRILDAEIAAARTANKDRGLKSFVGVRFGESVKGSPIRSERLGDDPSSGVALVMLGPMPKTTFGKFANPPLVRVTPKTHRIFQIEFTQPVVRKAGWTFSAETTNFVAKLSRRLKCEPFALDYAKYPLGNHTFVFPLGDTTLTVGEYGGEQLKLIVENASVRELVQAETAALQREEQAETLVRAKPLTSDKYPNSGMVKRGRLRMKSGTPRSFCGIVFGSLPPYSAAMAAPMSRTSNRHYYIDYRKTKCTPFMTFDHGLVEISAINNAALAVDLYSDGSDSGLGDEEFFSQARAAVESRFKVKPVEVDGTGTIANLTYKVYDLTIKLGPDPRGGFYLKAAHTAMQAVW